MIFLIFGKIAFTLAGFCDEVLIVLSRYLNQETAKWPFRSSSQATNCYYQSNHSTVEAIPLSALLKNTTSELAGLS